MASRVWMVTRGVASPSVAGTGLVTDSATDTGAGFMLLAVRDVTVGTKKDILEGIERIRQFILSEASTSPPQ